MAEPTMMLATILLLFVFRSILLPFVIGIALAYLLNPVVTWLERIRISRTWATAIVLFFVLALVVGFFLMLVPLVADQVFGLVARLPEPTPASAAATIVENTTPASVVMTTFGNTFACVAL